jgi:hypothetical protein
MRFLKTALAAFTACIGALLVAWLAVAGITWLGYGRLGVDRQADERLDRFMPAYDVTEHHETRVAAPADVTFAVAATMRLEQSPLISAIFRAREFFLRVPPESQAPPAPLLTQMRQLGWGALSEEPGRFIVMGAVTKPWEKHVTFRALSPEEFAAFHEPGYVKILWTLEAQPVTPDTSVFRTRTRAATTDAEARAKFRTYWAFFSPGIWLIRFESLRTVRAQAERRHRRV